MNLSKSRVWAFAWGLVAAGASCDKDDDRTERVQACRALEAPVQAFLADVASCTKDDACRVVSGVGPWGDAVQHRDLCCGFAARTGVDDATLTAKIQAFPAAERCSACATVSCVAPSALAATCDVSTGRCKLVAR
jgi:hypothetical protein